MKFDNGLSQVRVQHLKQTSKALSDALVLGKLGNYTKDELSTMRISSRVGYRVGMVEVDAHLAAPRLLSELRKGDMGALRALISWSFVGDPYCHMRGKLLEFGAAWPPHLATTDIRLSQIQPNPQGFAKNGDIVWFPGVAQNGDVVAFSLGKSCPHLLVAGATNSGKSVAMRNAVLQLAELHPKVKLILIDCKQGEGLGPVAHVAGQVAPLARTEMEIEAACSWLAAQVKNRNARIPDRHDERDRFLKRLVPIVVFLDEIQEMVENATVVEAVRLISSQGRSAKIHLVVGTQKPLVDVFGSKTAKANLPGRLALRVTDVHESMLAVGGSSPRADTLQQWEAYAISPDPAFTDGYRRLQLFNVTEDELERAPTSEPEMEEYPMVSFSDVIGGKVELNIRGRQLAAGLSTLAVNPKAGRPTVQRAWEAVNQPINGTDEARAALELLRDTMTSLNELGFTVRPN